MDHCADILQEAIQQVRDIRHALPCANISTQETLQYLQVTSAGGRVAIARHALALVTAAAPPSD